VPAGAVWRATNLSGGGRYAGAQLSAQLLVQYHRSKFNLQANFDRVKALVKQAAGGQEYQQIFVPLYNGNIALSWHRPKNQFAVNTQFVGDRFIQTDNLASLPAYALVNATWRLTGLLNPKGFRMDVGVQTQNLTQTSYYSMPGRPMPGRSVQFTLWIQTVSKSHVNTIK
jgi:iron complex outermembrane receptor protein